MKTYFSPMKLQFHTDETLVSSNGNSLKTLAKLELCEHRKSHIVGIITDLRLP